MITINTWQQNQSNQSFQVKLDDNSIVSLTVFFDATSTQCFYMDIEYNDINLYGIKIVNFYSLLGAQKNILPFDILCSHQAGIDPSDVNDFYNEYASLSILTQAEIIELENILFND